VLKLRIQKNMKKKREKSDRKFRIFEEFKGSEKHEKVKFLHISPMR